jgi:transcriptional regulator with XRE-family HTH domain
MKQLTEQDVVNIMRKRQGDRTQAELAEDLGITPQHLSDIFLGRRTPGPIILEKLGLEKEVLYRAKKNGGSRGM